MAWSRRRHVDELGVLALVLVAIAAATALVTGSGTAVAVQASVTTGLCGLAFFASLLVLPRPLTFYVGRRFAGLELDEWDGLWRYAGFRRVQRRLTAAWGVVLLGEATFRAVATWLLGADGFMLVANQVLPYAVVAVMTAVSIRTGRRHQVAAAGGGRSALTRRGERRPQRQNRPRACGVGRAPGDRLIRCRDG
ncbi:VC0807 family protein [Jatrophihabitans endophyticus]|uniref:VC0807 family protein n=1 Tax=Jatrophihabitans endophyticus TaxID=1206085 RepID=UPI000933070D|nr:VC0807 family protein [Jatrophihabitans endophyticus]